MLNEFVTTTGSQTVETPLRGIQGRTVVDFGSTLTSKSIRVTINGQSSIPADAWLFARLAGLDGTVDHTPEEHLLENIEVRASNVVPGQSFDIEVQPTIGMVYGKWNVMWWYVL